MTQVNYTILNSVRTQGNVGGRLLEGGHLGSPRSIRAQGLQEPREQILNGGGLGNATDIVVDFLHQGLICRQRGPAALLLGQAAD